MKEKTGRKHIQKDLLAWLPKYFSMHTTYIWFNKEHCQIHLCNWQFYLPQTFRRLDMWSPELFGSNCAVHIMGIYSHIHKMWKERNFMISMDVSLNRLEKQSIFVQIDQSHKSHNAPVPYPTMHHFGTYKCTFLLQNGALWDVCLMHCSICVMDLLDP